MFLGKQVRDEIDHFTNMGFGREGWADNLETIFFLHRSSSWIILCLITVIFWISRKRKDLRIIHWAFVMLAIELLSGVILNHFNVPGLVQTAHLLFAFILFGILMMATFRLKTKEIA